MNRQNQDANDAPDHRRQRPANRQQDQEQIQERIEADVVEDVEDPNEVMIGDMANRYLRGRRRQVFDEQAAERWAQMQLRNLRQEYRQKKAIIRRQRDFLINRARGRLRDPVAGGIGLFEAVRRLEDPYWMPDAGPPPPPLNPAYLPFVTPIIYGATLLVGGDLWRSRESADLDRRAIREFQYYVQAVCADAVRARWADPAVITENHHQSDVLRHYERQLPPYVSSTDQWLWHRSQAPPEDDLETEAMNFTGPNLGKNLASYNLLGFKLCGRGAYFRNRATSSAEEDAQENGRYRLALLSIQEARLNVHNEALMELETLNQIAVYAQNRAPPIALAAH